tara:strand:+ start:171 stop:1268 length:1098 start_codon:yes stop_codon:yes gene_type:complete
MTGISELVPVNLFYSCLSEFMNGVDMKKYLVRLIVGSGILLASGCTAQAKKEVRSIVDQERSRILSAQSKYEDPLANKYLGIIAESILSAARSLDLDENHQVSDNETLDIYDQFTVYIVHDPTPNAWVVGDDFACISTAAILHAEHPEELAFILGHEFGHLRGEHQVESYERKYANKFAAGLAVGLGSLSAGYQSSNNPNYSQAQYQRDMANALAAGQSIIASFEPHRKSDEYESDKIALELMVEAGFPIERSPDWLERMLVIYGEGDGKTHPKTEKRVKRIRDLVHEYGELNSTRTFNLEQFREIQDRIRSETLALADDENLAFYSAERPTLSSGVLPPIKSCGPSDAELDQIVDYYSKMILGN